jgi:hypothetical protein
MDLLASPCFSSSTQSSLTTLRVVSARRPPAKARLRGIVGLGAAKVKTPSGWAWRSQEARIMEGAERGTVVGSTSPLGSQGKRVWVPRCESNRRPTRRRRRHGPVKTNLRPSVAARRAGPPCARGAPSVSPRDRSSITLSEEHRQGTRRVLALALMAGNRRVGVAHGAQGIEA